jgi:nucleoside-diphosphate-sugar epimerase
MRLFVTGITGFVGRAVARELIGCGYDLVALVRDRGQAESLRSLRITPVVGDLARPSTYATAMADGSGVVHLAAEIATQRNGRKVWATNVHGTRALVRTACDTGQERFLFMSTVVTGEAHGRILSEDSDLVADTVYGRSKREGERLVIEAARAGRINGVILRPSHIYGAGGWYGDIVRAMRRRLFMIPGSGENWWDAVHVDDVAQAVRACLESPTPAEICHIVDDDPITMNEFFGRTAAALGQRAPGHVPVWLAKLVKGGDPIRAAVRSARSTNAKIKARYALRLRYPSSVEGIRDTIQQLVR